MIYEAKYPFHKWMMLLKFKKHTVVEEWGSISPLVGEKIFTLENNKRERVKLREFEYSVLKKVICNEHD